MPLITRQQHCRTQSDSSSEYYSSDAYSERSASTAPTYHSTEPSGRSRAERKYEREKTYDEEPQYEYYEHASTRSSVETYASTTPSVDDFDTGLLPFQAPEEYFQYSSPSVLAATPHEFAEHFPSTRRMFIKHDDTTDDGNMNLRIDATASTSDGPKIDLTLFHLRMHDLKGREFSFRRYCRDSGKEICHSSRKWTKPSIMRPGLQRSMSNALSGLRSKSENKTSTIKDLKRQDSGYDSTYDEDREATKAPSSRGGIPRRSSNSITLEFSNYAHLKLERKGAKSSKRYSFEYWGTRYAWRRTAMSSGGFNETSYHLIDIGSRTPVAHIVPIPLSNSETREEEAKGGWVPPCSMWISDESIFDKPSDVADVIVASGIIALVDDCIRRQWHRKDHFQLTMPHPFLSPPVGIDSNRSKRLIDEVFGRRERQTLQRPTLLRHMTS